MTGKLRVLIVDDHPDTAQQLEVLVASWNHVPRIALTGARAMEIAAEFRPTVVLVDLNLPDRHGYEVAKQLRAQADGPITFIAITGWGQIADQLLSTAAGISHHLVKPVNANVLREILDACPPAETVGESPRHNGGGVVVHDLTKLAALIRRDRERLLAGWREQVRELPGAQHLDAPTLNDHLPGLLEELADALDAGSEETIAEALREGTPPNHGLQRLADGFDIGEVVAEYNILRGSIHDLAESNGLSLQGRAFHILNRVLDGAIGLAVETYASGRAQEVRHRREEYLAFVAHDLRTPLNAIALAARVLDLKLPSQDGNAESVLIKTLHRNVRQVEALVGKVLEENSGPETEDGPALERRSFDLWPLVETLVRDLQPVAEKGSTHLANLVPDDLVVFADAGQLKRVFQNLIGNAIGYTPRGEVSIGAEAHEKDGTVECWVTDDGAGIPAELLGSVFEKGESDPEKDNGGSGLGLAIVKTFVEAHGGWVRAESVLGEGTTLRFSLPSRTAVTVDG